MMKNQVCEGCNAQCNLYKSFNANSTSRVLSLFALALWSWLRIPDRRDGGNVIEYLSVLRVQNEVYLIKGCQLEIVFKTAGS